MKVKCLMVTEDRAPVFGVSYASLLEQTDWADTLYMAAPRSQMGEYQEARRRRDPRWIAPRCAVLEKLFSVPESIHILANNAFEWLQPDQLDLQTICLMWDDDDIAPTDRIQRTKQVISAFHPHPVITSYTAGWFVNARTLHGYKLDLMGEKEYGRQRLWGGCLAWNHAAWKGSPGFWGAPFPGQDRHFASYAGEDTRIVPIPAEDHELPIALCHTKNVASMYQERGDPMEKKLEEWLPPRVFAEVKGFQKFCVDNRVFPPWSD